MYISKFLKTLTPLFIPHYFHWHIYDCNSAIKYPNYLCILGFNVDSYVSRCALWHSYIFIVQQIYWLIRKNEDIHPNTMDGLTLQFQFQNLYSVNIHNTTTFWSCRKRRSLLGFSTKCMISLSLFALFSCSHSIKSGPRVLLKPAIPSATVISPVNVCHATGPY